MKVQKKQEYQKPNGVREQAKHGRLQIGMGWRLIGLGLVLEDVFQWAAKSVGNAEGKFQRWRVFGVFDGHDRLARDARPFGQFFLRHLIGVKAQSPDRIGNDWPLAHQVNHPCR